jgi:hypothetical protein
MKKFFTLSFLSFALVSLAQPQITNGGFELWDNVGTATEEPQNFNSNKSGSSTAQLGPQTCFRDAAIKHSGSYSVRVESKYYILAVVNGNVTTGVVNAPSSNKSEGYIGTINYSNGADVRRMAFTGRPDSLVGWYQYTQATGGTGFASEQGKVRAILHSGDYNDPEIPVNSNHPNLSANKIGDALFYTAMANNTVWKRFSVPFSYVSSNIPAYIMINVTSSANQLTTAPNSSSAGSKLWLDDLAVIYNSTAGINEKHEHSTVKVYNFGRTLYAELSEKNDHDGILTVFDLTGKAVANQKLDNKKNSLDLSALNSGLYIYQVIGSDLKKTGKIILE